MIDTQLQGGPRPGLISDPVRMAKWLQACGWTLADAAWGAVNWDLWTLAAAVANERAARGINPTMLSDAQLATLKIEIEEAKNPPTILRPRKTTRIIPTKPKLTPRSATKD